MLGSLENAGIDWLVFRWEEDNYVDNADVETIGDENDVWAIHMLTEC